MYLKAQDMFCVLSAMRVCCDNIHAKYIEILDCYEAGNDYRMGPEWRVRVYRTLADCYSLLIFNWILSC